MVNPDVRTEPTTTRTRNEENGRRIYITKKMVSEFGVTLGCKGCSVIGQPHKEECRAKITARMENDPLHAKLLESNLNRRNEFADLETTVAVPSEGRTDGTKRSRQDQLETPQETAETGGASSSSAGADVDMRVIHAGKRPLDPGDDQDMVCGLDVCDDLDELDDGVTRVTLLRDDVAKARMEEMRWYEKFQACEEGTDETCVLRTARKPFLKRWRAHSASSPCQWTQIGIHVLLRPSTCHALCRTLSSHLT